MILKSHFIGHSAAPGLDLPFIWIYLFISNIQWVCCVTQSDSHFNKELYPKYFLIVLPNQFSETSHPVLRSDDIKQVLVATTIFFSDHGI